MQITSVNLSALPFMGSCDSTRAQMASKQAAQAITHENCHVPYVISNEYRNLSETSFLGLCIAKDDGYVVFNNNELIIIFYTNLNELKEYKIPLYQKTSGYYCSKLTYMLEQDRPFKKGDIVYSYDNFKNGIPSFGYNTLTAYMNGWGLNHEDALLLSESFLERAKVRLSEKVYIPVFEYTILLPSYNDVEGSLTYFPNIGQKINGDVVCSVLKPSSMQAFESHQTIKTKMTRFYNSLTLSDLLNLNNESTQAIKVDGITSKVKGGKVTGISVHKLYKKESPKLIDGKFQRCLDKLVSMQTDENIIAPFNDLQYKVNRDYAKQIIKNYMMYIPDTISANASQLKNAKYLIELEITRESGSQKGDKFANRFAGKGICSTPLPDDLRPIAMSCNRPIDCIFNSFGVYSRMNISQIIEGVVSKEVMLSEERMLNDPNCCVSELTKINENIISNLNTTDYYTDISNLISRMNKDPQVVKEFIKDVKSNGFFIEAPSFSVLNVKKLIKQNRSHVESIKLKKETLMYMKDKLKFELPFTINGDVVIKNKFVVPIYTFKLYKLASEIVAARDLGKCRFITKQPMRGKSNDGGKRLGQMEIEAIIAHGAMKSLHELLTVKSDCVDAKKDMLKSIILDGEYHMDTSINHDGETKKVVDTLIKFIND